MVDQDITTGGTGTAGRDDASRNAASVPSAPPRSLAEEVGLPVRPLKEEPLPTSSALGNDVARILEAVKLPERKDFRAGADSVPHMQEDATEPEEIPEQPPEPKPRDIVSAIHTLKDDFQTAVTDNKLSLVQAAALQETKRFQAKPEQVANFANAERRQRLMKNVVLIAAFVLLGATALGGIFAVVSTRSSIEPTTFLVEGILFTEQTVPFPIQNKSAQELRRILSSVRASSGLTLGAITRIAPVFESFAKNGAPVQKEATTQEFFEALNANVPDELVRALDKEFFFGFHTVDENAPMLIIPVTAYERAFAGVLAWEKTMNEDLAPVFTPVPALIRQPDGLLVDREFEDTVMRNFDVRVLKDDSGTIQLYYSFPSRNILIISESPYSFTEILSRLRADRRL